MVLRDMTLENPIRAIREISHDLTCTRRVRLANGREASALDIQTRVPQPGPALRRDPGLPAPGDQRALEMWEHCLTGIEKDPFSLDRECDWVIKHNLIEDYRETHDLPLSHPQVALVDLQYHDVNRDRGLFYRMQARGLVERVCTDEEIDRGGRRAAADHAGPAARRVHPQGQGAQARLHGRLGAPEAQRPGPAHGAVQGPVQGSRRAGREAHRQPLMPSFRRGRVGRIIQERAGLQRVEVHPGAEPDGGDQGTGEPAYVLTQLTGPVAPGDEVLYNDTAVQLGLGTGGWHVVHANLTRGEWGEPGGGHVLKLRYTSLQADTGVQEERTPDVATDLDGMPVVACTLHSQLGVVVAAARRRAALGAHRLRHDRRRRPAVGPQRPRGRAEGPSAARGHHHRRPGLRRRRRGRRRALGAGPGAPPPRCRRGRRGHGARRGRHGLGARHQRPRGSSGPRRGGGARRPSGSLRAGVRRRRPTPSPWRQPPRPHRARPRAVAGRRSCSPRPRRAARRPGGATRRGRGGGRRRRPPRSTRPASR